MRDGDTEDHVCSVLYTLYSHVHYNLLQPFCTTSRFGVMQGVHNSQTAILNSAKLYCNSIWFNSLLFDPAFSLPECLRELGP